MRKSTAVWIGLGAVGAAAVLLCGLARAQSRAEFSFTLAQPALTSAGVYDAQDRLVRALWTLKALPAGKQSGEWDGRDDFGQDATLGSYHFTVIANRATYRNVGAIGNSGLPPNAAGHTPAHMEGVAVDASGAVYTANGWDEAGADFKKWSAAGESVYDAHFQIRNSQPNGAPYAIAVDDRYLYCSVGAWAREPWNECQQIQRFRLSDGRPVKFTKVDRDDGHINVYEWPSRQIPKGTPEKEAALLKLPLRGLAVRRSSLWVADMLGNRVLRFDKETGEPRGEFAVQRPQALAIDPLGRIWVGHQHHLVSVFTENGQLLGRPLSGMDEVEALAFGPRSQLYLADSGGGRVKIFDLRAGETRLARTLGDKAHPGERAADRFYGLRGVAVAPNGEIVTIQNEPMGGARLARWAADGRLLWEQFGNEFVSLGNYGQDQPDLFYSMTFHRYRLLDPEAGQWEYLGNTFAGDKLHADVRGVPRVLRLGENDFYFLPSGDGVQVYRIDGAVLRLAAAIGGGWPAPDGSRAKQAGEWSWHDVSGRAAPRPPEVRWFRPLGQARYEVFGMDVDASGNVWYANLKTRSLWELPLGPLDARGNPTYDWAKARQVVGRDASSLDFQPTMVQRGDDGSLYAFGWSANWPAPKENPFWMGGTTLVRYAANGERLWAAQLPEVCVGLDTVPGGGCMVGTGKSANVLHYSSGGLLIGRMAPGEAMRGQTGWMDNHASVAVNRNPRDGRLDVFAEDDYALRIGWYRVDDRPIETLSGSLELR